MIFTGFINTACEQCETENFSYATQWDKNIGKSESQKYFRNSNFELL